MNLFAFHIYNDYSGSPVVLRTILDGLLDSGWKVTLATSEGGVLDELASHPNVSFVRIPYRFSRNKPLTFLRYCMANIRGFFTALGHSRDSVFYINTVLPVGAALAARLRKRPILFHYHENAFSRNILYRFCAKGMQFTADSIVCVSDYQKRFLKRKEGIVTVPNTVAPSFLHDARKDPEEAFNRRRVLLVASLRKYKGIAAFLRLAALLPDINFCLVLNDTPEAVAEWLALNRIDPSPNLEIHSRQPHVVDFYNRASIVLNLSDPDLFIETFGMTVIEAFSCGLPVIVPEKGGIADLVTEGANGFHVSVHNLDRVKARIKEMLSDRELYMRLAENALAAAKLYEPHRQIESISRLLADLLPSVK